jgi:hypothetical protein
MSVTTASLKERISSPLEAGTSLLDAHHLPPHLSPALEYVSTRLARKAMHITLVVARRDYQLPSVVPPMGSPGFSPITPCSPPSARFAFSQNPVNKLKLLVRSGSAFTSSVSSPAQTPASADFPGLRSRWPMSPATPLSPPPMTPSTASLASESLTSTDVSEQITQTEFGMRLIHAGDLSQKEDRALQMALSKADKKFGFGYVPVSITYQMACANLASVKNGLVLLPVQLLAA